MQNLLRSLSWEEVKKFVVSPIHGIRKLNFDNLVGTMTQANYDRTCSGTRVVPHPYFIVILTFIEYYLTNHISSNMSPQR